MPPQKEKYDTLIASQNNNDGGTFTDDLRVGKCQVKAIGLENFIRSVVKEIDLHIVDKVIFNMNERGVLHSWSDVFRVEKTYTSCLGISERHYQCHSYIHKPEERMAYFILEEVNKRSMSFLPQFKFFVLVFCYYGEDKAVTMVDVQYDQLSFFLHCIGAVNVHRWFVANILTPIALCWMNIFQAIGIVHPITFLLILLLVPFAFIWYMFIRENEN